LSEQEWCGTDLCRGKQSRKWSEGTARKAKDVAANLGKLLMRFHWFDAWGAYYILDTDYKNYSIVYSCFGGVFGAYQKEYHWIYSRAPLNPNIQGSADADTYGVIYKAAVETYKKNFMGQDIFGNMRR
jgi:lipocalin